MAERFRWAAWVKITDAIFGVSPGLCIDSDYHYLDYRDLSFLRVSDGCVRNPELRRGGLRQGVADQVGGEFHLPRPGTAVGEHAGDRVPVKGFGRLPTQPSHQVRQ